MTLIPPAPRGRSRSNSQAGGSSRFSAWFHGRSVIGDERSRSSHRTPKTWRSREQSVHRDGLASPSNVSGLRSPSSTRSIIDPTSSPNIGSDHADRSVLNRINGERPLVMRARSYTQEQRTIAVEDTRIRTRLALSRPRKKPGIARERGRYSPRIADRRVKRKAIGCLVSGGLLAIVLTTCKSKDGP